MAVEAEASRQVMAISRHTKLKEHEIMKTLNHLLLAAAAAFTLNVAPATAAPNNTALLHSPRYLEAHPELLRGQPSGGESKTVYQARLTENIALANSPRFREAHPELRVTPSADQSLAQNVSASDRLSKLTQNRAFAASPRFVELHPELSRSTPVYQIAPLK